jgi:preprotein translocase subunit SecF
LFDDSISSTLGRTFNTSFTVILVILAIFFGGDNLKGFMFALFLGIFFGTYSSIFVASAIAYDFLKTGKEEAPHEKQQQINKFKALFGALFYCKNLTIDISKIYLSSFLL